MKFRTAEFQVKAALSFFVKRIMKNRGGKDCRLLYKQC